VSAIPRPPKHLGPNGSRLWRRVLETYDLSECHHLVLLQIAAEALDRLAQARAAIDKDGITVDDRYGSPKAHPALTVERDSRAGLIRALRELSLDSAALEEYSRPPMISGGKRYGRHAG